MHASRVSYSGGGGGIYPRHEFDMAMGFLGNLFSGFENLILLSVANSKAFSSITKHFKVLRGG
jgi:hypothetical protein